MEQNLTEKLEIEAVGEAGAPPKRMTGALRETAERRLMYFDDSAQSIRIAVLHGAEGRREGHEAVPGSLHSVRGLPAGITR